MVDGKASLYVGSPRMVEMAIGEKTTLEELGGARMHCEVSGCGDVLAASDEEAIELAKRYLALMPASYRETPAMKPAAEPKAGRSIDEIVPYDQRKWFDMYEVIDRLVHAGAAAGPDRHHGPGAGGERGLLQQDHGAAGE